MERFQIIGHPERLLLCHDSDNRRNGVAIVLDNNFKPSVINVTRKSDHLSAVKLALVNQQVKNVICTYAPKVGCSQADRTQFLEDADNLINDICSNEHNVIDGDLKGNVGTKDITGSAIHGEFGIGEINKQGKEFLVFATRHSISLINTNQFQ